MMSPTARIDAMSMFTLETQQPSRGETTASSCRLSAVEIYLTKLQLHAQYIEKNVYIDVITAVNTINT